MVPIFNYVSISSLEASFNTIQPLFLAMPVEIGGLALPPRQVGIILGTFGIVNSICQTMLLGWLVRGFGVKKVFFGASCAFIPLFMFPPMMNILVAKTGFSYLVWMILVCQFLCLIAAELAYGMLFSLKFASFVDLTFTRMCIHVHYGRCS